MIGLHLRKIPTKDWGLPQQWSAVFTIKKAIRHVWSVSTKRVSSSEIFLMEGEQIKKTLDCSPCMICQTKSEEDQVENPISHETVLNFIVERVEYECRIIAVHRHRTILVNLIYFGFAPPLEVPLFICLNLGLNLHFISTYIFFFFSLNSDAVLNFEMNIAFYCRGH